MQKVEKLKKIKKIKNEQSKKAKCRKVEKKTKSRQVKKFAGQEIYVRKVSKSRKKKKERKVEKPKTVCHFARSFTQKVKKTKTKSPNPENLIFCKKCHFRAMRLPVRGALRFFGQTNSHGGSTINGQFMGLLRETKHHGSPWGYTSIALRLLDVSCKLTSPWKSPCLPSPITSKSMGRFHSYVLLEGDPGWPPKMRIWSSKNGQLTWKILEYV